MLSSRDTFDLPHFLVPFTTPVITDPYMLEVGNLWTACFLPGGFMLPIGVQRIKIFEIVVSNSLQLFWVVAAARFSKE